MAHQGCVQNGDFEFATAENLDPGNSNRGYVLRINVANLFPPYETLVALFAGVEPDQYYFPRSDIHITVFEFVSVRPDFLSHRAHLATFQTVCRSVLARWEGFAIELRGTVFTKSSGIVAGFDHGVLIALREEIRRELGRYGVAPLERYQSRSAHVSFMAFRAPVKPGPVHQHPVPPSYRAIRSFEVRCRTFDPRHRTLGGREGYLKVAASELKPSGPDLKAPASEPGASAPNL